MDQVKSALGLEKKAIHFGAGNIGRGFIGPLLFNSGYKVIFADVVQPLLDSLNNPQLPHYTVNVLSKEGIAHEQYKQSQYIGVNSMDPKLMEHFEDAELITTSVGPAILPKIAMSLFSGLKARQKKNPKAQLNVIACENLVGGTDKLKQETFKLLENEKFTSDISDKKAFEQYIIDTVGFANCAVDRIVPPVPRSDDPSKVLDVTVEEFCEWDVDMSGLKFDPKVKGMVETANLSAYVERKLFTVNTAHCILAYLGHNKGYKTIDESVKDPEIYKAARGAIEESGAAICRHYPQEFKEDSHKKYIDTIIDHRMKNDKLVDEVDRVGRASKRKLAKGDRLVGPALMCMKYGLPTTNLATGVAGALLFDVPTDEEAPEVQLSIKNDGVEGALLKYSGLSKEGKEGEFVQNVLKEYERLKTEKK